MPNYPYLNDKQIDKIKVKKLAIWVQSVCKQASKQPLSQNRNTIMDQESTMPQGTRRNKHLSSILM